MKFSPAGCNRGIRAGGQAPLNVLRGVMNQNACLCVLVANG
jgi:hypothetical protein